MGNLFDSFGHPDSIAFLLSVLVSFLIGFVTAWILWGSRAKRLQRDLDALKKKQSALEAELAPLREQLSLKEADLVRATREAGDAIMLSRSLEGEKTQWQLGLEAARTEAETAKAAALSYAVTVEDLNQQVVELKANLEQLTAENEGLQASYAAAVEDWNQQKLVLQADLAEVTEEKEGQEEALSLATAAYIRQDSADDEQALNRLSALEARLNLLSAENESLKAQVAAEDEGADQRFAALEARLNALTAENESLKVQVASEHEEPVVDDSWYDQVTMRFNGLEDRLGKLSQENEALKTELAGLQNTPPLVVEADPEPPTVVEVFGEVDDEISIVTEETTAEVVEEVIIVIEDAPNEEEAIVIVPETPEVAEPNPSVEIIIEAEPAPAPAADDAKAALLAAFGDKIPFATEAERDDLTRIKGIGSFIEHKLNGLGIYTFEQISRLDADLVDKLTAATEFFPGRIERDDWVGQAKLLAQPSLADTVIIPISSKKLQDLKIVEGIGPKIEKLLKAEGIKTLGQLAAAPQERLREILLAAGEAYRIHDPTTWPAQAELAAKGEWDKLKQYQEVLDGGREKF